MKQESQSVQSRNVNDLLCESLVVETSHYSHGEVNNNRLHEMLLANKIEKHFLCFALACDIGHEDVPSAL
jgi:hypothetical protein